MKHAKMKYVPTSEVHLYDRDAYVFSPEDINQICDVVSAFGMLPVVVNAGQVVVHGQEFALAAKQLGLPEIPCFFREDLSEDEQVAYRLILHNLRSLGGFDAEKKMEELARTTIDMSAFGFNMKEAEEMLNKSAGPGFTYREQYAVIVMCEDEAAQESTYNALLGLGYDCKVVAV